MFKEFLRNIVPPIFIKLWRRTSRQGWHGNFVSWEEAEKMCTGYDSEVIIDRVKNATLLVKEGKAIYERDSVIFDKVEYSYPLLASLMWIAAKNEGKLNVIDFGGSLGSTYYQNRFFLQELREVKWNIVEQVKFVDIGRELFKSDHLNFYYNFEDCYENGNDSQIIVLSNVIQYINKPYELLQKIINSGIKYIIIDLTAFINKSDDLLTIQKVPPHIYNASYPCWFFNEDKFLGILKEKYELIIDFDGYIVKSVLVDNGFKADYKGFFFRRK